MSVKDNLNKAVGRVGKTLRTSWGTQSQLNIWIERNTDTVTCNSQSGQATTLYGCNSNSESGVSIGALTAGTKLDVSEYKYLHIFSAYNAASTSSAVEITY